MGEGLGVRGMSFNASAVFVTVYGSVREADPEESAWIEGAKPEARGILRDGSELVLVRRLSVRSR